MVKEQDDLTVVYLWARKEAEDEIKVLRAENERLMAERDEALAALQFYANPHVWRSCTVYMCGHGGETRATQDAGAKARAALGEDKPLEDRWDNA